jgi:hypothetical protein
MKMIIFSRSIKTHFSFCNKGIWCRNSFVNPARPIFVSIENKQTDQKI